MSVAAQTAFAASLVGEPSARMHAWNDAVLELEKAIQHREEEAA